LEANGNVVTGRVWEDGGLTGPSEIRDGRTDGTNITLNYPVRNRTFRTADQLRPEIVALRRDQPDTNPTSITLTGVLRNDKIEFRSVVNNLNQSNAAPRQGGRFGQLLPRLVGQAGALGFYITDRFTVTRSSSTTVTGTVVVEEKWIPRPVFQLRFVDTNGKTFSPPTRDVWTAVQRPVSMFPLLGSPFDAVSRNDTDGFPGNPSEFIVRLPPGDYRPIVTGLPNGYTLTAVRARSLDLTNAPLRIVRGNPAPEVTVVLGIDPKAPWTSVAGRITNFDTRTAERGGNLSGKVTSPPTAIVLVNRAFSEYWIAPITTDGQFEFPRVLPGNYEVRAFPDTSVTPALNLTVPPSSNVNLKLQAPDVKALSCGAC
jgi:hypothetical protein